MTVFLDSEATRAHVGRLLSSTDATIRKSTIERFLRTLPGRESEVLLEGLLCDRVEEVRVAACNALTYRARNVEGAGIGALSSALREGRRELVLPAAEGLAARGEAESFQPLLLVFKAGEQHERKRAVIAMGALGDKRVLEELEPLVEGSGELEPEEAELLPAIIEAFGQMVGALESNKHSEDAERVRGVVENMAREGTDALRTSALVGMRRGGGERARTFIEAIAADGLESASIRRTAISQLAEIGSAESESVLAEIIRSGDYAAGSAALSALQDIFPGERTRTQLLALTSTDTNLSGPAASFLSWFGDVETLVERLTAVTDVGIRSRLRRGLVRRGACPASEIAELLKSEDLGDRADASWIVGAANAKDAKDAKDAEDKKLHAALSSALASAPAAYASAAQAGTKDARAREAIDRALEAWLAGLWAANRVGADGRDAAVAALEDSKLPQLLPERLRVVAARYLSERGSSADVPLLTTLLSDRHGEVRNVAASGIAALSPDSAVSLVQEALVADTVALRPVVAAALSSADNAGSLLADVSTRRVVLGQLMESDDVASLVTAATESGTDPKRLAAIAALGRVGGSSAETTLTGVLDKADEDDAVRAATFRALRRLQRKAERMQGIEGQ